jgi:PucR family transcriptional regulator, purine catabolism regulatory protein
MPEIILRDLCRWERRLTLLAPSAMSQDAALDRPLSWAVSVRAAPPLLPPLRGDELVVLPLRVIEQIEAADTLDRNDLLAMLAQQNIAAILSEPGFTEEPLDVLPLLTLPAPFPHDIEAMLNRLITERRAELYRLGTELSRRLSQAVVDPRGLEALLGRAAELSDRSLVLQDPDGNVIAWGGDELISPADFDAMGAARQGGGPRLHPDRDSTERLIAPLSVGGRASYLSMIGPAGALTEADRLVLSQTAGTCAVVLGQGRATSLDRSGRQRLVADLLLGRLASDAAAMARAQMLGIDPLVSIIVGLIDGSVDLAVAREIIIDALGRAVADNLAAVPGGTGFLLPRVDPADAFQALKRVLSRNRSENVPIALSEPVDSVVRVPDGLRQARFALALHKNGALVMPVIRCDSVDDLGFYSLLYPLWGDPVVERFRTALLGPLEEYDRRRGSRLIETLEAYLSLGGALTEAADQIGIHRNTLSYRLQRIGELTGRDLGSPQDRLLLQIALASRYLPDLESKR